jgi:hypothetical protein
MSQVKIRQALESRLKAFATSKSLTVIWENVSSIPTGTYLRASIYRAPTQDPSIGAKHKRYRGIFRVQVCYEGLNTGPMPVETLAEELVAYFPRALKLTKDSVVVSIENTPSQSSISVEATWAVISIEMAYRADVITN